MGADAPHATWGAGKNVSPAANERPRRPLQSRRLPEEGSDGVPADRVSRPRGHDRAASASGARGPEGAARRRFAAASLAPGDSGNQKRVSQTGRSALGRNRRLVAGVGCLQLARRGGHELAPASYRERGKGIAGSRPSGRSLSGNAIVALVARFGAAALLSSGDRSSARSGGRRRSSPPWDQHRCPARTTASIRALAREVASIRCALWRTAGRLSHLGRTPAFVLTRV